MSFARSTSTTESKQISYQQQVQAGEGATAIGAGGTLIQTDLGAIKQAAALGESAIQGAVESAAGATQAVKSIAQTAIGSQEAVVSTALTKGAAGFSEFAGRLTDLASIQAQKDSQARQQELELAAALSSQVVTAKQPEAVTQTAATTEIVKYGLAAVSAIALGFFFFSRRRAAA